MAPEIFDQPEYDYSKFIIYEALHREEYEIPTEQLIEKQQMK